MEIHTLIVESPAGPRPLPLSHRFSVDLDSRTRTIHIAKLEAHTPNFEKEVLSFRALYGENGSGKTELLLQIGAAFAGIQSGQRISVLYSEGEALYLYKAKALDGWLLSKASIELAFAKNVPAANAVFYTTSPFENKRRAVVMRSRIYDVSPPFGRELYFDGLSFLESFSYIDGKAPFLQKLRIAVQAKLPSVDVVLQRVTSLFENEAFPGHDPRTVRLQLWTWISALSPPVAEITLLNLFLITSIDSSLTRSGEVIKFFGQRITNLIGNLSEDVEDEDAGQLLATLCEDFIADFPKYIPHTGAELWSYIRGPGKLLDRKRKTEIHGHPAERGGSHQRTQRVGVSQGNLWKWAY